MKLVYFKCNLNQVAISMCYLFKVCWLLPCSSKSFSSFRLSTGVISRGAQGVDSPLLKFFITLGAQPPLEILALALLFKIY